MENKEIKELAKVDKQVQKVTEVNLPALLEFNRLLNNAPKPGLIKVNDKTGGKPVKYLPIRVVESLLRSYFGAYQVEMIGNPHIIGNSVVVSVHLKVFHPVLNQWLTYAGTGAVAIELQATKKDNHGHVIREGARHALDFEKLNPMALHKNVPAAKSFAVSNAAKQIGKIFGSDLNNDELSEIYNIYGV